MVMLDAAQELPMDWREEEVTSIEEANPRLYVDPNFPLDYRLHKFLDRPRSPPGIHSSIGYCANFQGLHQRLCETTIVRGDGGRS
jgi:hypothetical protein